MGCFFMPARYEIYYFTVRIHNGCLSIPYGRSIYSQEKSFIINESLPIGIFLKRHWRQR